MTIVRGGESALARVTSAVVEFTFNDADGKVYGFAFDDVADFASFIQDGSPTAITLNLPAFA